MFVNTAQKMKFPIKDFLSKCDQILNGKLHFLAVQNKQNHKFLVYLELRFVRRLWINTRHIDNSCKLVKNLSDLL